jgi:hypothetical protein
MLARIEKPFVASAEAEPPPTRAIGRTNSTTRAAATLFFIGRV